MILPILRIVAPGLLLLGSMVGTTARPHTAPPPAAVKSVPEPAMLPVINAAREAQRTCGTQGYQRADPVVWDERLAQAAQLHATDLAAHSRVSHFGSDQGGPPQRLNRVGYAWSAFGENVAAGIPSGRTVVAAWLRSPQHCSVIMEPVFTEAGAAWARSPRGYRVYWVLEMGRPR